MSRDLRKGAHPPVTNRLTLISSAESQNPREAASVSGMQCPFCSQGNPQGAKFCSECGGALHLAPCPRCGAVNDVVATNCYQCRSPLREEGADAVAPSAEAPPATSTLGRASAKLVAMTAMISIGTVVLAYSAYRLIASERSPVPAMALPFGKPAATTPPGALPAAVAVPEVPKAPAATLADPDVGKGAVQKSKPRSARPTKAGPAARPAERAQKAAAPVDEEACPAEVAALDLCGPEPGRLAPANTAASGETTPGVPPQARGQTQTRAQNQTRECSAGVAALGLCPPDSNLQKD